MIILYVVLSLLILIVGIGFLFLVSKSKPKNQNKPEKKKDPFRFPTNDELDQVEKELTFKFSEDFRKFLKAGGDATDAKLDGKSIDVESMIIFSGFDGLYLVDIAKYAWEHKNLPKHLLPFVELDDGYFCVTEFNEVVYWSKEGVEEKQWAHFALWCEDVCGYELY